MLIYFISTSSEGMLMGSTYKKYSFVVHIGQNEKTITSDQLVDFSRLIGLESIIPGRYSWLFMFQLFINSEVNGIDPLMLVEEINRLEGGKIRIGTKEATMFKKKPLQGLWHKHFFAAHFIPKNICNQLSGGRLKMLAEKIFDPSISPVVTENMIHTFASMLSKGVVKERDTQRKLTGEWIVFAKHHGMNYYLCVATHNTGDSKIHDQIKAVCLPQFPFLSLASEAKNGIIP